MTTSLSFSATTAGRDETIELGKKIAAQLRPGAVITLKGTLGAGKTTFVQGLALGLDINETVTSPTYTIISEYRGRIPLYHMDLYRIADEDEFELLGVEEMIYGNGVSVIEWSEKAESILPENRIQVSIEIQDENTRTISVKGTA